MSKIDRLQIQGIRSFDNGTPENIYFSAPLTLIVGYNGAGKTTIIECLKYATTGQMPPNSKGGAFIHDPKLCGEKEVLARVMASFHSTTGAKLVVARRLQLTVKKATRSLKTLEGSLKLHNGPEKTTLSARVAELDLIVPQYLGVSTAILDSVIFCHQEESLWPMSEPSVLKKRFDEIFEALKYTKAIDNIKVLRKKQNEELAKYKIIEQHAKEDKDKGDRAEKRSIELHEEMEELRTQSEALGEKTKEATDKASEAWDHAAKYQKIVAQLEGKRIEANALRRSVDELKEHLKVMTDSDEELQSILDQYEERTALYERDNETQRQRYMSLRDELESTRKRLGAKQSEIGKFEAQKDQYERQLRQREILVKEAARAHDIRGYEIELNDDHVMDFMEKIGKVARDRHSVLEKARREAQASIQGIQRILNELNEKKSALNQSKESAKAEIAANDDRITKYQTEANNIEVDEAEKASLESAISDVQQKLSAAKTSWTSLDWESQSKSAELQVQTCEEQKERLDAELIAATNQAKEFARLDFIRKELKGRQRNVETMSGAHGARLAEAVGSDWSPATLEASFNSTLESKSNHVKEAEQKRDGAARELEQVEFKIATSASSLTQKQKVATECERAIRDETGEDPADFPEYLADLEQTWTITSSDSASFKQLGNYYKSCLETAKEHNACRLCMRPLREKDKEPFLKKLDGYIEQAVKDAARDNASQLEAELKAAKGLSATYDTWQRLKSQEVPQLEAEAKTMESNRTSLLTKVEQADNIVKQRQDSRRDVESLLKIVQSISRYHNEIGSFEKQIEELSSKQGNGGTARGLELIQEEMKHSIDETRQAKSKHQRIACDREAARVELTNLELQLKDVEAKLSSASYQLREKASLIGQISELKSTNGARREVIGKVEQEVEALSSRLDQTEAQYQDTAEQGAERERVLLQESNKLGDSIRQLKAAEADIHTYLDRGGPEQLSRAQREIENVGKEMEKIEAEQQRITVDMKKIENQLRDHTETQRNIGENLRYRKNVRDLEAVESEINELSAYNADKDKARYEREASKWQLERNRLSAEQASVIGNLKSKDDQLTRFLKDWDTDYKDAAYKYKEAHIRVETTKAAVEDLGRYGAALDKAIMKYHSMKMEEINRIVEELWKRTYQGTDVDTILIRSDNETLRGNKSYNYRVCMVKQDAEMDMRGRCSAGQKVLASIIIRLALAECFGVNCGLIALDEPTTNLDRDNIRALAEALAEIIRVRRQQSNFQLIIITHDEGFLRYMQCADFTDHYWRVSRNEKQKSIIEKQSIAHVM